MTNNLSGGRIDRDDKAMIQDPDRWPAWPFLPMKQRNMNDSPMAGFFHNDSLVDDTVIFYLGNMWGPSDAVKTDLTVEQVLADGWVVD